MSKLLYIQSSPRRSQSYSIAVANAFIETYRQANPGDEVTTINLFDKDLVAFDGNTLQGKYNLLHGKDYTPEEKAAWEAVEAEIEAFKYADKYVLAVPMWNFSIPYRLKHYIDIIVQPGYTFSYSPEEGFSGLVTGKPVFYAGARGNAYPAGSETAIMDMQTEYLDKILNFIGFTDIQSVLVEPTLSAPDEIAELQDQAIHKAREIAKAF
jgi:FMN-dependent NADH-azoreductase